MGANAFEHAGEKSFPVDAVFTWVDGSDPEWRKAKKLRADALAMKEGREPSAENTDDARFRDNDELRFAFRSLACHAPWVRKVHLVTANQKPAWLNTETVNLVSHADIFPDSTQLPVFSTRPIELCIHRIPGLAEHFLYFNDDFLLGRPLKPELFFQPNGLPVVWAVRQSKARLLREKRKTHHSTHTLAILNAVAAVRERFGCEFPYRMRHFPKAMTVTTANEVWQHFPEAVERTLNNPFRSESDVSITALYPLYLLATGKGRVRTVNGIRQIMDAFCGGVYHMGASLGDSNMEKKLKNIVRLRPRTFCINDSTAASERDRTLFCETVLSMYPEPSPFELPE